VNYELQFRQSFAKLRRKVDSNYAREGGSRSVSTRERGGVYIEEEGSQGVAGPRVSSLFIVPSSFPFMVITPSST
jgi:hypothetical protein